MVHLTGATALLVAGALTGLMIAAPFYPVQRLWRPHESRRFHLFTCCIPFLAGFVWCLPPLLAMGLSRLLR